MNDIVWKKPPLLIGAAIVLCGLSFWTARTTAPVQYRPAVTALPVETQEQASPVDFARCVEGTTTPKKTYYEVVLRNKCSVPLNEFVAKFKLYDLTDARVGWQNVNVGVLEPGERVRFRDNYNLTDNPKLSDGVGRVSLYEYEAQK